MKQILFLEKVTGDVNFDSWADEVSKFDGVHIFNESKPHDSLGYDFVVDDVKERAEEMVKTMRDGGEIEFWRLMYEKYGYLKMNQAGLIRDYAFVSDLGNKRQMMRLYKEILKSESKLNGDYQSKKIANPFDESDWVEVIYNDYEFNEEDIEESYRDLLFCSRNMHYATVYNVPDDFDPRKVDLDLFVDDPHSFRCSVQSAFLSYGFDGDIAPDVLKEQYGRNCYEIHKINIVANKIKEN